LRLCCLPTGLYCLPTRPRRSLAKVDECLLLPQGVAVPTPKIGSGAWSPPQRLYGVG
jgi:hypothetical protein